MKEFVTAVREENAPAVDIDDEIKFKHDGREVTFLKPSLGQLTIMMNMGRRDLDIKELGTFVALFFELMDDETQRHFQTRLMDRKDTFDLDGEGGIFEIWETLIEEWSGRPTKKPTDYVAPRRSTGGRSTGTSRAKGSTSSASRSRATSR